ncbi:MAG: hypothetical protein HYS81_00960 [Candidatus Aenigmatarchaeota archaeon]|nr:MAG: hypothetical protein HYS81_00960 [Candidatus Aenigmarchaeota archaeon]
MERFQEEFISNLLEWNAVKIAPDREHYFKLKSGRMSPYFVNMATAMDSGKRLWQTAEAYAGSVIPSDNDDIVAHGPAMKGIPLVPLIAAESWRLDRAAMKYAFDFKEGPVQISQDALIGVKLRHEKPGIKILDTLDAGTLKHTECNSVSAVALANDLYGRFVRNYSPDDVDVIVGKAYGGIGPAALLAREIAGRDNVDIRFVYDRVSAKTHGVSGESSFVGRLEENDRALVVDGHLESIGSVFGHVGDGERLRAFDDVITTGKAKRESKHKVEKRYPKAEWAGVHVAVYRGEVDETGKTVPEALEEHGLAPLSWIVTAEEIFEFAHESKRIDDRAMDDFKTYMKEFGAKA